MPDASIDVWQLVWALANGAAARGARILPYHRVVALHREDDAVTGAEPARRAHRRGRSASRRRFTINASGAWAHEIAEMAGIEGVSVVPGKGIMIAMNHRLVNTVVNRCTMPADGDILVPIRTVSVIGTTDIRSAHPDDLPVTQEEVDQMLDDGERLVPGFRSHRALRVWAGVRPLFDDKKAGGSTRDVSRGTALLDHRERDGVEALHHDHRRQAHDLPAHGRGGRRRDGRAARPRPAVHDEDDAAARDRRTARTCARARGCAPATATCSPTSSSASASSSSAARSRVRMRARGSHNLDDIRRNLRLGMGPCQGGFCIYRATGILHGLDRSTARRRPRPCGAFLEERWKGVWPILYGDQLRQARLDDWIFQGILDVEHLP